MVAGLLAWPAHADDIEKAIRAGHFEKAVRLLEEKAKAGDSAAQFKLASFYRTGRGVTQDDGRAFQWMLQAAEAGHGKAQAHVARMSPVVRHRLPPTATPQSSTLLAPYWHSA